MSESTPTPKEDAEVAPQAVAPIDASPNDGSTGDASPVEGQAKADVAIESSDSPATLEAAPEGEASDEGPKRKRKRRRRKKKKATTEATPTAGDIDQASDQASATPHTHDEPRGEPPPFQHLFAIAKESTEPRPPGFKVGSLVAGHVVFFGDGAAVINLYGKGTAFVLEDEPREIPTLVVHEPEAESGETDDEDEADEVADPAIDDEAVEEGPTDDGVSIAEESARPTAFVTRAGARLFDAMPDEPSETTPAVLEDATSDSDPTSVLEAIAEPNSTRADEVPEAPVHAPTVATDEETSSETNAEASPAEPETLAAAALPPLELGQLFRGRVGAVAESGHVALVNRNIDRAQARARLREAKNARLRVRGLVFGYNRGGFDVLVEGMRAYCPVRGLSITPISDPLPMLGRVLEFQVQAAKSGKQGIVVSRRTLLEREAKKAARHRLKQLTVGEVVDGKVERVFEFGLIVDLGDGLQGMVHKSELSWDHAIRPADVAGPGDPVRVKVLEIELPTKPKPAAKDETGEERPDRDKRKKRRSSISLSIKALEQDPWMAQIGELRAGKAVRGTVVSTTEFGAFVEIAPNVQGLLHVSELERPDGREDPIAHANEILAVGDALVVVVERIERDRKRVALSLLDPSDLPAFEAGTLDDTGNADRVRPGGQVEVRVVGADRNGVRVRVAGVLGKRGRGFIRPGDTGTQRGTDLRKKFQVGTVLEVKVVGTDRDGSLRCSIKALAVDEERQAIKAYKQKAQKEGFGTLGDLLRSKLSER